MHNKIENNLNLLFINNIIQVKKIDNRVNPIFFSDTL